MWCHFPGCRFICCYSHMRFLITGPLEKGSWLFGINFSLSILRFPTCPFFLFFFRINFDKLCVLQNNISWFVFEHSRYNHHVCQLWETAHIGLNWLVEAISYGHMASTCVLNCLQNCFPCLVDQISEPLLFYALLLGPPNFSYLGTCYPITLSGIISSRIASICVGKVVC